VRVVGVAGTCVAVSTCPGVLLGVAVCAITQYTIMMISCSCAHSVVCWYQEYLQGVLVKCCFQGGPLAEHVCNACSHTGRGGGWRQRQVGYAPVAKVPALAGVVYGVNTSHYQVHLSISVRVGSHQHHPMMEGQSKWAVVRGSVALGLAMQCHAIHGCQAGPTPGGVTRWFVECCAHPVVQRGHVHPGVHRLSV
jgi:hypothetical protein